ncbi:MAG: hypothetical protein J6Q72_00690 [Clostridia bacterium]|nr:hypothetical protein [Clostridia bacterium]
MKNNQTEEKAKKQKVKLSRAMSILFVVLSVLAAFVLWVYAIGYDSTLFERTFDGISVVIEGEAALRDTKGYTLASGQEFSSITVVAKGKMSELNELSADDFRAVIDVSQAQAAGDQTLNIVVYSPNGIEIVSQSSTTASVFVDEFTQKNELLSVSVDVGNSYIMAEGVTFVSASANPLSVLVEGPASVIGQIKGAYVKFDLENRVITDNIYGYGAIELRDADGRVIDNPYIKLSDTTAYVTVSVTKQKSIPVRVAFTGGVFSPSDAAIELSASAITVSGTPEALKSIDELVLNIDETAIDGSKSFEFPIGSLLPNGVSNESGSSKISVKVTMPELAVRAYRIKKEAISVINLPENSAFEISDDITVYLIGPREAFGSVDRNALSATVDFNRITIEDEGYSGSALIELGNEYDGIYVLNKEYTVYFTVSILKKSI